MLVAAVVLLLSLSSSTHAFNELVEGMTEADFEMARTINGFNSTVLLATIAVGAVLILLVGVGLYLYDVYSDNSKNDYYYSDYSGYYNTNTYASPQQAYPAVYQQQAYNRYR